MADEQKQPNKTSKSKSHWRKPVGLLKVGNKEKGHAFVEKRRMIALREYKKLLKKTRKERLLHETTDNKAKNILEQSVRGSDGTPFVQESVNCEKSFEIALQGTGKRNHQQQQKPVNRLTVVRSEFKKRQLEKEKQIKEREAMIQKHRKEVQEKIKKRRETFGRLNRRTRKGQPVMANQIEHLLGKLQAET